VDADVKGGSACVRFDGNAGVTLDCQGHDLTSIRLNGVQDFTIRNCQAHLGDVHTIEIVNSSRVTIENSDVLGQVFLDGSRQTLLRNSSFRMPVKPPSSAGFVSCEVCFYGGSDNSLSGSTVDGGWDGNVTTTYQRQGVDDAVGTSNESRPTIVDNVIMNAFDAGIESSANAGPMTAAVIRNNQISHVGFTGIASFYIAGWQSSVFSGNTVSDAPSLLDFDLSGASLAGVSTSTLVDNVIESNTFRNPVPLPPLYGGRVTASMLIDFVTGGLSGTIANNVVRNNDFGTASPGPKLAPASGFVDGGGNVCSGSSILACQ